MAEKLFNIKTMSPATDWFAVLDVGGGKASVLRVIAWIVLEEEQPEGDEVAAVVPSADGGLFYVGSFYDQLAGYIHASERGDIQKRFSLSEGE